MEKDFEVQVTKAQLLNQQYNSMVSNNWCLVNARIYNKDRTRYRKIKLVECIDADDLYEYYYDDEKSEEENDRGYTKQEILWMAKENALFTIEAYMNNYDDTKDVYNYANETIEKYNRCGTW